MRDKKKGSKRDRKGNEWKERGNGGQRKRQKENKGRRGKGRVTEGKKQFKVSMFTIIFHSDFIHSATLAPEIPHIVSLNTLEETLQSPSINSDKQAIFLCIPYSPQFHFISCNKCHFSLL